METPTTLLGAKSMQQSTLTEHNSYGVVCPECGYEAADHKAYSIHYGKKQTGHEGNPVVARFGEKRLINLYWNNEYDEIADILGIGSTTVFNAYDDLDVAKKTKQNRVAWEHNVSKDRLAYHLHHDAGMSTLRMSEVLGISRRAVDRLFEQVDVKKRNQSEAEQHKWDQLSDADREERIAELSEEFHNKQSGAKALRQWRENNPEEFQRIVEEAAPKGAPAREENGMAGVTGQDNPNWRGGKSIYDAVKKQLNPESWKRTRKRIRERAGHECEHCGGESGRDRDLDVHHIVPLMAGGTNEDWNLIALCESCHREVEAYTRDLADMESVLTEEVAE